VHISTQRRNLYLRLFLHGGHKVNGRLVHDYFGMLGSVIAEPSISMAERERFWTELDGRLCAIAAKHPRLDAAEVIKIKASLARHVPKPPTPAPAKSVAKRQVRSVSVEA
jgi:hypothetical protein